MVADVPHITLTATLVQQPLLSNLSTNILIFVVLVVGPLDVDLSSRWARITRCMVRGYIDKAREV